MFRKIENLDDLRKLPNGILLQIVRKGNTPIDNFFVLGEFDSISDDVWLNISHSRISHAQPRLFSEAWNAVLGSIPQEKSVISYRLTGFSDPDKNFPSQYYEIWYKA